MEIWIPPEVRKMYKEKGIEEESEIQSTEKVVMDKYTRTKAERKGCATEKARMDSLRMLFRKRLIVDLKEKRDGGFPAASGR